MADLSVTDLRNPAPAAGQPRPAQLKALTSVRFLAALYVALYHMVRPFSLWGPFAAFMGAGYTGVSFFFLLSGFILTYSHAADHATGPGHGAAFRKRFYFARFARIYPVYLLTTVVAGIYGHALFSKHVHIVAYLADLLMLQSWSIRMVSFFNVPAWSVSVEVFFYLVFPFVFLKLRPTSRSRALGALGGFWALAMALPLFAMEKFPAGTWVEENGLFAFWVRRFSPFALPEFLAGIVLGWFFLRYRPSSRQSVVLALCGAAGVFAVLFGSAHVPAILLHNGLLIPFFGMVLLGLSDANWVSRLFSGRVFLLLGEASYSLYLSHFMLNDFLNEHGLHSGVRSMLVKMAIALPLSVGLYLLVERPSRKRLLVWWNRDHGAARS